MQDLQKIEGVAIPACTLDGMPWYSEAHYTSLTDDNLVPRDPERIFLSKGLRGYTKASEWADSTGHPAIVFGLTYSPAVGIPDLDECVFQAGEIIEAPEFLRNRHPVEMGACARLAIPDDTLIALAVRDLRRRVAHFVKLANASFMARFKDADVSEAWVNRQVGVPVAWAARALFSAKKSLERGDLKV